MPDAAAPAAPPTATEIVHRPDPGLGRGVWEAPAWTLYALLAGVVLAALVYAAMRLGLVRRKRAP